MCKKTDKSQYFEALFVAVVQIKGNDTIKENVKVERQMEDIVEVVGKNDNVKVEHNDQVVEDFKLASQNVTLKKEEMNIWENLDRDSECRFVLGNPYTRNISICSQEKAICLSSDALQSSNCKLRDFIIRPSMIKVAKGEESIEQVLGQAESAEFPEYSKGAILHSCSGMKMDGVRLAHYMNDFFGSMDSGNLKCQHRVSKPTFAITRYDYANLYHTACDWFNFYQAIQIFGHRSTDINVLLLDGHPKGALDESWEIAFGKVFRIHDFEKFSSVCFDELYIVSPGYKIPLFPGTMNEVDKCHSGSKHLEDFSQSFIRKYEVTSDSEKIIIGYIFRKDYLAHPRQGANPRISRKIRNEKELLEYVQNHLSQIIKKKFELVPLYLEKMELREQIKTIAKCQILVGVHGAGLTHALFMKPQTVLLEIAPPSHASLKFFDILAKAKGLHYIVQTNGISGPSDNLEIDLSTHRDYLNEAIQKLAL
jgi:hypothetical protein